MIGASGLANFLACFIPETKKAAMQRQILEYFGGQQELINYRNMVGLQWWVVGALMLPKRWMNGTSAPLKSGNELDQGPNTWVHERATISKQMRRWENFASTANGRPVAAALASRVPMLRAGKPLACWTSDACTSDPDTAREGIGGVQGGMYWQYLVPDELAGILHITALEACGTVGNTIHFSPLHQDGTQVLTEADAVSTVTLAASQTTNKDDLVFIQQQHESLASFQQQHRTIVPRHLFGGINTMADWVSRDKLKLFHNTCKQMGITARHIPLDPEFDRFFRSLVSFHHVNTTSQ